MKRHFREGDTCRPTSQMNSCLALRIVTVWEPWGLPAICAPSRTADARNVRIVWFSEPSNTSSLMPPQGYTCAFDQKKSACFCRNCVGIQFRRCRLTWWCFLVRRLSIFLLCERHRQRLRRRRVRWLFPLALGTHVCSPELDGKPHLRFTCFSPDHVEKAATPFSRPRKFVHMGATAYIDEQSPSDKAVSRWRPLRKSHNCFFHVSVYISCLSSSAYSRTHFPRYSQAHFPTISSGIRTPDTCKNIFGTFLVWLKSCCALTKTLELKLRPL